MEENNFAEVLKALLASGLPSDPSQLGECLRSLGIDGRNPEAIQDMLGKMGLDCEDMQKKDEIVSQINQITAGFSREKRRQIGGLFEEMAHQMGCEELPPDFLDFLDRWKRGG
ncbi:MAG TPA: hypothetical protein GXX19_11935 [Syntrophomonadaceae bacterium]|nr:hypothetical protein [Syntrophomonadaceae bacterium]